MSCFVVGGGEEKGRCGALGVTGDGGDLQAELVVEVAHDGTDVCSLVSVIGVREMTLRGAVSGKVKAGDSVIWGVEGEEVGCEGGQEGGTLGGGVAVTEKRDGIAVLNGAVGGNETAEEVVVRVENGESVFAQYHLRDPRGVGLVMLC